MEKTSFSMEKALFSMEKTSFSMEKKSFSMEKTSYPWKKDRFHAVSKNVSESQLYFGGLCCSKNALSFLFFNNWFLEVIKKWLLCSPSRPPPSPICVYFRMCSWIRLISSSNARRPFVTRKHWAITNTSWLVAVLTFPVPFASNYGRRKRHTTNVVEPWRALVHKKVTRIVPQWNGDL